jgi:hypothetical protein
MQIDLILKFPLPFPALNAAQMYHHFLPSKLQFLDVTIHPEADMQKKTQLA